MGLALALLFFAVGLTAIIKGGEILVNAAISLNKKTGINQVIIGATFISVATTLPEVFVSIYAVAAGNHGIAVGNAFGAMITNISLVLGITLAFTAASIKRSEILPKALFLLLTTLLVFLFSINLLISWYEGVILLVVFALFLLLNARESKVTAPTFIPIEPRCVNETKAKTTWLGIICGFVLGQVFLCFGAFALVENGEKLANIFGISETVIGFTVIAIGTSLPELTTTIASIRRKCNGLAIGNVIGANVISCTLLFGICGIIGDIKGESLPLSRETAFIAIPILFLMTLVATVPIFFKSRAYRIQGFILLLLYAIFVVYLMVLQPL